MQKYSTLALPTEEEQTELLRELHRHVLRHGDRARDAAARLNVEWRERVAKYIDQVTGGDPTSERPGADYRGIHHGLVLALRHRLEPFKATYEYGQPDELRKLRGIDNALECAILVLLAEDADFDETAWGFEPLGQWNSAHVIRTAREWADLGCPGLLNNRALIRLFAVSTMYTHLRTWVPRFAVLWAMARHVCKTLAAAEPAPEPIPAVPTIGAAVVPGPIVAAPPTPVREGHAAQLKREEDYHVAILEVIKAMVERDSTALIARRAVVAAVSDLGFSFSAGSLHKHWSGVRELVTKAGVDCCMKLVPDTGETKEPLCLLPGKLPALVRHLERARRAAADAAG